MVGGIIPPSDQAKLAEIGVARVYTPKDFRLTQVMAEIADLVLAERSGNGSGELHQPAPDNRSAPGDHPPKEQS